MNMMIKLIILLGKGAIWVVSSVGQMIAGIAVAVAASSEMKEKNFL